MSCSLQRFRSTTARQWGRQRMPEISPLRTSRHFCSPTPTCISMAIPQCCVLGFHSYDFEPGVPSNGNLERRYVLNYSSWISPGLFGGGFQDVTALSHELSETFNDPFVASDGIHNVTPWWLSPN